MTIEELRQLYCSVPDEEKPNIALIGQAVKLNPKYGSKEMGGNGYCKQCFLVLARPGHWNCERCSRQYVSQRRSTINEIIKKVRERKPDNDSQKVEAFDKDVESIFG